jgi:hypothetical protein
MTSRSGYPRDPSTCHLQRPHQEKSPSEFNKCDQVRCTTVYRQGCPPSKLEFSASAAWRKHSLHVEKKHILWSEPQTRRLVCANEVYFTDDADESILDW